MDHEGEELLNSEDNRQSTTDEDSKSGNESFIASAISSIDSKEVIQKLADQSVFHTLTRSINTDTDILKTDSVFRFYTHYSSSQFFGIMIDTGTVFKSIAGYSQYQVLKDL